MFRLWQTFLWWANPAVPVNDHTYSVFPPDVHAVMDHGKRAVSTFPIATGEYYKYDYSEGVDISMYKNVPVPTSYMAAHSDYDFIGNYDAKENAGLLHVADHHISPGKKQWTWGNTDFGKAWDRNLTDEDGPYIELMTGVYTDNQPDFTWLKPQEEKTFVQYFMPYKGVGRVKNATKDAMINFEIQDGIGKILFYTSGSYEDISLLVIDKDGDICFEQSFHTTPCSYIEKDFPVSHGDPEGYQIIARTKDQEDLLSFTFEKEELEPTPSPADPLPAPEDLKTTEELFLGAQHLEQYRHATSEPADYYLEGLKRDPSDMRLNNGYGMLLLRRGHFQEAKAHFEKAIEKQTWKNPNPYYGECYFNLGLVESYLGEDEKAFDSFYKSTWSYETQGSGYYHLALLSCKKKDYQRALDFLKESLLRNWHNMKTRTLTLGIKRILNAEDSSFLAESIKIDPLYMGLLYEKGKRDAAMESFTNSMRDNAHNYLELSTLYMEAGLYEDALSILDLAGDISPLVSYYKGYIYSLLGENDMAKNCFMNGEMQNPDLCFPNKLIEINIFNGATRINESGAYAYYYLGNLLYDKKQYALAMSHWETAISLDQTLAMAYRNLSIAYYNKLKDKTKALKAMEKAYLLEPDYPRFLLEYDQLKAKNNTPPKNRLEYLETHMELVQERDVLYLEYIKLFNLTGNYEKALDALSHHIFHPWEGGEGKVTAQYRYALTELALLKMKDKQYSEAIKFLTSTLTYPENLGEGKLPNVPDNIAFYYIGKCYQALGETGKAKEFFVEASKGSDKPNLMLYYNDQPSDPILYQGLAYKELGDNKLSRKCFSSLKSFGQKHIFDEVHYDFFAVSLPDLNVYQEDLKENKVSYCEYLMALGEIGLGNQETARELLENILKRHPDYQGAVQHILFLERDL
ncbi:DUF5107 domain-containing protein [Aequitasia blattaphilus]|nr:DUF5107 domain-containing protein [Aequitasia blattaphilus]